MPNAIPLISIAVLAHNEERRIAACLASLPLGQDGCAIHVIVNGSSDRTADIARSIAGTTNNVTVHDYTEGGKSRNWNRLVFDIVDKFSPYHIFVDGDAVVAKGSVKALVHALQDDSSANAAAAMPLNGRSAEKYRDQMTSQHGLFGDLYALRGDFLARMKAESIRLPNDLIGDDGLIASLAKTDLRDESHWDDSRVVPCTGAGFYCEEVHLLNFRTLAGQYKRMINYSVRHFQNKIVSHIMRGPGPKGLPRQINTLYADALPGFTPRASAKWWWFDRRALARMAAAIPDPKEQPPQKVCA